MRATELQRSKQEYGSEPLAVRDTEQYRQEYVHSFVEKWDALIDWDRRAKSEGRFFIEQLRARGARRVLDVATGTGFHSVQLMQAGFEVTSVDGNANMLAKAFDNARRRSFILRTIHADWRWLTRHVHEKYDAIICLGNSFTHLFSERDRRRALAEFYAVLRHDGFLLLDQRNYDAILDQGFRSKHAYYYCGQDIQAEPEHVDPGLARFRYAFPDGSTYHLNMFPLRKAYLRSLAMDVGFQQVTTFGDFQETFREPEPDFFVHVAEKRFVASEAERVGGQG